MSGYLELQALSVWGLKELVDFHKWKNEIFSSKSNNQKRNGQTDRNGISISIGQSTIRNFKLFPRVAGANPPAV